MFEENNLASSQMTVESANQAPVNLPVDRSGSAPAEPEDILESVDVTERTSAGSGTATTTPLGIGVVRPAVVSPQSRSVSAVSAESAEESAGRLKRAIMIIAAILIAGGVIGAGGYLYQKMTATPITNQATATNQQTNTAATNDQNTNQPVSTTNTAVQPPPPPLDTDRDGLTDEEEALYGTDPRRVDTDNDGLTDRDEAKTFKTDPTKVDTDGDGFTDGEEVSKGYDPKGPGRLLQIPVQ